MICHRCESGIASSPAIVFGPGRLDVQPSKEVPHPPESTTKYYLCANCWDQLDQFLHTPHGTMKAMTQVCIDILKLDKFISLHASFEKHWEPIVAQAKKAISFKRGGTVL